MDVKTWFDDYHANESRVFFIKLKTTKLYMQ